MNPVKGGETSMNTEDTKQIKAESEKLVDGSKREETLEIPKPKHGWFFSNVGEGTPFGIEAETKEEAEEANRRHLEAIKKEKH